METPRFLVVDDDPDIRETVAEELRGMGFEVDEAADAFEALAKLKQAKHDVLITDDQMPGMRGTELVRITNADPRHPYTVVVSGTAEVDEVMSAGAQDFFPKPCSLGDLLALF